jgi:hypothetical protein
MVNSSNEIEFLEPLQNPSFFHYYAFEAPFSPSLYYLRRTLFYPNPEKKKAKINYLDLENLMLKK